MQMSRWTSGKIQKAIPNPAKDKESEGGSVSEKKICTSQGRTIQGSMLRSQFTAIFDNFGQKMAFFSKPNVMIKILHK
jgi:hypothetical protein